MNMRCPYCNALLRAELPLRLELVAPGDPLKEPIDHLDVSVRTYNNLMQAGIHTLAQLIENSEAELQKKHFGRKSVVELIEVLGAKGLKLRAEQVVQQREES